MAKFNKFTRPGEKLAIREIKKIWDENPNMGASPMAAALNQTAATHPNGEWTSTRAQNFITSRKLNRKSKAPPLVKNTIERSDKIALAELILSANMTAEDKERVLTGLFT